MWQPVRQRAITREQYDAVLLDLDGVLTATANLHAAAWKQMADTYLQPRVAARGEPFRPFEVATDYRLYVDGKLRLDGVRAFLTSRGIELPEGTPDDPPQADTMSGLGNRKNALVHQAIKAVGAEPSAGSLKLLRQLRLREGERLVIRHATEAIPLTREQPQAVRPVSRW